MKVVGITTPQEVYIGSRSRNFRINEFLIVEDKVQGDLPGEIVEARTFNRFIPLSVGGDFVDSSVLESLRAMGYDINEETIYIGKLRLLKEAQYPVITGSDIRIPKFSEVKKLILPIEPEDGLVLGVIRNTDSLTGDMADNYKNLLDIYEDDKYLKQDDVPFVFDYKSMHQYPHIGVFGGSGSGKSFGLRVILEELMEKNIPTVVMDPHYEMSFKDKSDSNFAREYSEMSMELQIGKEIGIRFEDLNRNDLIKLLNTSSPLTESMVNVISIMFDTNMSYFMFDQKLEGLLQAQDLGGIDKIDEKILYSENEEKNQWIERKKIYEKYDKSCPNASVRGVFWRLRRLFGEGIFGKDISSIVDGLRAGKLIVIQGSTRMIQVFSTYLLSKLYSKRRQYRESKMIGDVEGEFFPPFVIVTDEAHNFAPKGYETPSKSIIREIAQEGRKYGVFLILATQRPTLLDETTTAQLNSKFIFRTVRASDIDTIKEETDITPDEAKRLPYLSTGDVFISSARLGRTSYVRIRAAHTKSPHKENPFDELKEVKYRENEEFLTYIKDSLPLNTSTDYLNLSREISKRFQKNYSIDQIELKFEELLKAGILVKESTFLGDTYKLREQDED
ncbi:ATP-binding protein [Peptoniphilus catoniae]|uniref:ATP-binding protein n=1 Tax=Peptoniphilus catoniae TaxID=1660341 RepID=UPI0010FED03B|nr:ATP-binding protein [Peptoniphilus catoniae]